MSEEPTFFIKTKTQIERLKKGIVTFSKKTEENKNIRYMYCFHCRRWFGKSRGTIHYNKFLLNGQFKEEMNKILNEFDGPNSFFESVKDELLMKFETYIRSQRKFRSIPDHEYKKGMVEEKKHLVSINNFMDEEMNLIEENGVFEKRVEFEEVECGELKGFEEVECGENSEVKGFEEVENEDIEVFNEQVEFEERGREEQIINQNMDATNILSKIDSWDLYGISKNILCNVFDNDFFDVQLFIKEINTLFHGQEVLRTKEEIDKINKSKKKIVSIIQIFLFSFLKLSKTQCKVISSFINSVLKMNDCDASFRFNKLNASYSTMIRTNSIIFNQNEDNLKDLIRGCQCFSLSIDSTVINSVDIYGVIMRISFPEYFFQIPIVLEECKIMGNSHSVSLWLWDIFINLGLDMGKCVSVTTDGDNSMIGLENGISKLLINKCIELKRFQDDLIIKLSNHTLWCFDHRLHLTAQSLEKIEMTKCLMVFIKWFCSSTNLKKYYKFVSSSQLKRIPLLSNTRWLFVGDAMRVIKEQWKEVVGYVDQEENQISVVKLMQINKCKLFDIEINSFHLQEPNLQRLFFFISDVVNYFNDLNVALQLADGNVLHTYSLIRIFIDFIDQQIREVGNHNYSCFPSLNSIVIYEIQCDYSGILSQIKTNLLLRFSVLCYSVNMRSIDKKVNFKTTEIPDNVFFDVKANSKIELFLIIYYLPNKIINGEPYQLPFEFEILKDELDSLSLFINSNKTLIQIIYEKRKNATPRLVKKVIDVIGEDQRICLSDVLSLTTAGKYPLLFKLTYVINTILPTSVSVESLFSYMKNILKPNMNIETLRKKLFMRLRIDVHKHYHFKK